MELEGTPWERGQIHGEKLKKIIWEFIERWKYRLLIQLGIDPDKYIDKLYNETNFILAVKKWAPHLLEEVKGIGEGAGVDFKTIFAMQLYDEIVWYPKLLQKDNLEHCSALGCFKEDDNQALLAQTLDLANMFDGFQILQHIKYPESSLESFILTSPGFIGFGGMNNGPIGITCNALTRILNPSIDGFPVAFIVRAVLEQETLDKAVKFIYDIKHASGQNYIIGNSEKVVSLECSANKVCQYVPYKDARRIYHTNHPLVNDEVIFPPPSSEWVGSTSTRFNYLENRLKDQSKKISVETIKNILSSHEGPICVHNNHQPEGGVTFGALIYVLSSKPELHLTMGPPCSTEWKIYKY